MVTTTFRNNACQRIYTKYLSFSMTFYPGSGKIKICNRFDLHILFWHEHLPWQLNLHVSRRSNVWFRHSTAVQMPNRYPSVAWKRAMHVRKDSRWLICRKTFHATPPFRLIVWKDRIRQNYPTDRNCVANFRIDQISMTQVQFSKTRSVWALSYCFL